MNLKKILVIALVITLGIIFFALKSKPTEINIVDHNTDKGINLDKRTNLIAYGHVDPINRNFLLSIVDLNECKEIFKRDLGNLFTRKIFYCVKTGQVWIPAESEKDLKYISNKIKILNLKSNKVDEIKVGLSPVDIQFMDNIAIITCLERGIRDVSVYFIDTDNLLTIEKTIIGGDTFEFSELDPVNKVAYFTTEDVDNKISKLSVIDLKSFDFKQYDYPDIPLHGIKLVNDHLWLAGGNQILIVNPNDGQIIKKIKTEIIAYEMQYDGEKVYLSHYYPDAQQQKGLSIIDPNTLLITKFPLPDILPSSITEKNKKLYVVDEMVGSLHIIDPNSNKQINTIQLGKFPTNILILK